MCFPWSSWCARRLRQDLDTPSSDAERSEGGDCEMPARVVRDSSRRQPNLLLRRLSSMQRRKEQWQLVAQQPLLIPLYSTRTDSNDRVP